MCTGLPPQLPGREIPTCPFRRLGTGNVLIRTPRTTREIRLTVRENKTCVSRTITSTETENDRYTESRVINWKDPV